MASKEGQTSLLYGIPVKHISLVILTVQNSALVLTMRYSRILAGPRYLTSTAVVLSEALKCVICVIVHLHQQRFPSEHIQLPLVSADSRPSRRYGLHQLLEDLFGQKSGFIKLLVPAVLYTLQNNLQFIAASNLDAATFQVTYQCKILTTAVFAVALLRQSLSLRKWMSLVILTIGVAFVQIPSSSTVTDTGHRFLGLMAVAVACLLSGLAGVYFEKILKGTSASIWLRNIQLGFASMAIAVVGAVAWDGPVIRADGFFHGYNLVVVSTILIQAMGGLVVAMVIKHADNILKGFATSMSIILSTIVSVFLFDFVVTVFFLLGSSLVLLATYLYSLPDATKLPVEPLLMDSVDRGGMSEKV